MKLSLAMIVKNEAALIGHCLASVRELVDEIILVDTGSEDETVEIARQFGAKISLFPWVDDFAAARNASLAPCRGDWVLILDADEAVDILDHPTIRRACEEDQPQARRLVIRNYFSSGAQATLDEPAQLNQSSYAEGREHAYYADFRGLRLCRRYPDLRFEGRIHELLDPFFMARGLPIVNLDAVIHHYGKLMEDREKQKGRYYLDLALQDAQREPGNHQFHFNIVIQAMAVQNWPVVLTAAETYMKLQSSVPSTILFGAGTALQQLNRHQEALAYFDWLLKAMPLHAAALTQRGISLSVLGRIDEARASFRKAAKVQPGFVMALLNLTELECQLGNTGPARAAIEEGLTVCPSDPQLLHGRVKLDLLFRDVGRAVEDARTALARCPRGGEGLWHRLVALAEQREGNTEQALVLLREGLAVFPEDPELVRLQARFTPEGRG
jgi:tetratricopeptide (TPR) repeat protein